MAETYFQNKADPRLSALIYSQEGLWYFHQFQNLPQSFQRSLRRQGFGNFEQLKSAIHLEKWQEVNASALLQVNPLQTEVLNQNVWLATESWSEAWELSYADWIKTHLTTDFFTRYQIATDCADVAFALRWIFARIHKLPAAVQLPGSRAIFSHESFLRDWQSLPRSENWWEDQVFRAALEYVLDNVYTGSLGGDSYPIEIKPGVFTAGTHHLELHATYGHTLFVKEITANQVLVYNSTVPRAVRNLRSAFYDYARPQEEGRGGFLKFRWPEKIAGQWVLRSASSMPSYSREQYDPEFLKLNELFDFSLSVKLRLGLPVDYRQSFGEGLISIRSAFKERDLIVKEGFDFCSINPCAPGSANYESWSTPSRDRRILDRIEGAQRILQRFGPSDSEFQNTWDRFIFGPAFSVGGKNFKNWQLIDRWIKQSYSFDPRDNIEKRWAISPINIHD
jgi:hypothetical protein